jgi:hypothetical protein
VFTRDRVVVVVSPCLHGTGWWWWCPRVYTGQGDGGGVPVFTRDVVKRSLFCGGGVTGGTSGTSVLM